MILADPCAKSSPDDLLQHRLDYGWQPEETLLQTGRAILGHVACLVVKPAAQ